MSSPSSDDRTASRAEARRRARLAARGELPAEPEVDEDVPQSKRNFLQRIFPPAPPLPNRPDPLAGFDRDAPLRPVRERLFLLRHNLVAWLVMGIVAFLGYIASSFYGSSVLGLIGTFVLFGSLIAAGWIGWQRPTLFGTAAGLIGFVLAAGFIIFSFAQANVTPETFGSTGQFATQLGIQGLYQAGLGFLGGWYGGYLRRRQTQLNAETRRRR